MNDTPLVRLELDRMKISFLHYFSDYQEKISNSVKQEIENAIAEFDFEKSVRDIAKNVIDQAIKDYFSYGGGSKIIKNSVFESLENIFNTANEE